MISAKSSKVKSQLMHKQKKAQIRKYKTVNKITERARVEGSISASGNFLVN